MKGWIQLKTVPGAWLTATSAIRNYYAVLTPEKTLELRAGRDLQSVPDHVLRFGAVHWIQPREDETAPPHAFDMITLLPKSRESAIYTLCPGALGRAPLASRFPGACPLTAPAAPASEPETHQWLRHIIPYLHPSRVHASFRKYVGPPVALNHSPAAEVSIQLEGVSRFLLASILRPAGKQGAPDPALADGVAVVLSFSIVSLDGSQVIREEAHSWQAAHEQCAAVQRSLESEPGANPAASRWLARSLRGSESASASDAAVRTARAIEAAEARQRASNAAVQVRVPPPPPRAGPGTRPNPAPPGPR